MQRREFITLFVVMAGMRPLAAQAQRPARLKRIAFVKLFFVLKANAEL
ncbi:hypothetical protein [Bradyrhizobium canariense]|nr:hypothetical protein [Bradyrhizobium canariense]